MPTNALLVLGGAGFLGTAVIRAALERDFSVVALVRGRPQESEFVRTRLYERVHLLGGSADDTTRLRQIIESHEIRAVVQAAAGETLAATHAITHRLLAAVARTEARPAVVVPLRAADRRPGYRGDPRLRTAFVELPDLFGAGDLRLHRFAPLAFASAAMTQPLPAAAHDHGYLPATAAAEVLLDATSVKPDEDGTWLRPAAMATAATLLGAIQAENGLKLASEPTHLSEAVKETLAWYRGNVARFAGRMPADGRRIAA